YILILTLKNVEQVTNGANQELLPGAVTAEAIGQTVAVVETRQTAGKIEQPKDAYSRFFLILSGSMYWQCAERRFLLGPDTLCHVPAGLTFQQEITTNQEVQAYVLRY